MYLDPWLVIAWERDILLCMCKMFDGVVDNKSLGDVLTTGDGGDREMSSFEQ